MARPSRDLSSRSARFAREAVWESLTPWWSSRGSRTHIQRQHWPTAGACCILLRAPALGHARRW